MSKNLRRVKDMLDGNYKHKIQSGYTPDTPDRKVGDKWIDSDDVIPTLMFHGTADLIVPFNWGFPFTIDIALPIVYGSNAIHGRLNELNINNEFHPAEGELHEYWGTVNGNWFGGPNENYDEIKATSYNFLYSLLDNIQIGDVNGDGVLNILDIVMIVNMLLDNEYSNIADINTDGFINILDIVMLVNILVDELQ